ncbi:glycosyltransferase 61 family protein [Paracoccus angustae]|uniref:Glycosyltransferase 61 family protein n=1 Tax=Paracoccus angustae TaxID=1671480 RepID=A0ABV7UBU6_9RHOB
MNENDRSVIELKKQIFYLYNFISSIANFFKQALAKIFSNDRVLEGISRLDVNPKLLEKSKQKNNFDLAGTEAHIQDSPKRNKDVNWAQARSGICAPSPLLFSKIEVAPACEFYRNKTMIDGGPVWPDFEYNEIVRHYRHDGPIDKNGRPTGAELLRIRRPAIWGGRMIPHFGHLVAEHMNRLAASLYYRPDDIVIFTTPPGIGKHRVPGYFWAIADWFGLPRNQIRLVKRPLLVDELRVTPQAECLLSCTPPAWHLDLLDEVAQLNRLKPEANDVVFVCRKGYLAMGKGGTAGEEALIEALSRAGVLILDPARESLKRQMELYAGAKILIFSEGSAVHGLCCTNRLLIGLPLSPDRFILRPL